MTDCLIRRARVPLPLFQAPPSWTGAMGVEMAEIDLRITGGRIAELGPAGSIVPREGETAIDLDRGIVLPGFVDAHTHLDKGHIWPRQPNPDGTFPGALAAVAQDREAHWTARDVAARMDFALRSAEVHGTVAIRTHIDSIGKQIGISWPIYAATRDAWRGRITLQASPLFGIERALDPDHMAAVVAAVRRHGDGILGAVAYPIPELEAALDVMVTTAMAEGFALDFHVDESSDPERRGLEAIAEAVMRHGYTGTVLCGHCCTLALQTPEATARIIGKVRDAGIAIVSLPLCNMYLQDRTAGRTPRWRGVTALHELMTAGVPVLVASDNTRDPFYAYGDLDMLEVYRAATRVAHFDHPTGGWPALLAAAPAHVMLLDGLGKVGEGRAADLVLTRARSWTELLSRPQADRVVLRRGVALAGKLPDYRELDPILGEPAP